MSVLDRIYEAAFVPELWPKVLGEIAEGSAANSGAILIIDDRLPPLFTATDNVIETLDSFSQSPFWYVNPPAHRLRKLKYPGFLERAEFFQDNERQPDNPYHINMQKIGADWQVATIIDMPEGEMALYTFERNHGLPDFDKSQLTYLDSLRPHLARAGVIATRLQLQRAEANVAAMNAMSVPACVVTASGVVMSTNALFDELSHVLRPAAFGRLSAKDRHADKLLQAAMPAPGYTQTPPTRSFPMHLDDGARAIVVHVIPLYRAATDIFNQGAAMVAVTGYSVDGNLPPDAVLRGLFDLTVAEAAIATDLAAGKTLKDIAIQRGIALTTARSQLANVFRKTGTSQQGQLIALLKGTGQLPSA